MNDRWRRFVRAWPFWALGALAVVFVFMLVFSRKAPHITSLAPSMAAPGETVVVSGDYFGRTEQEGVLSLAGEIPPPSLIQSWSDQRIAFVVPEDASSGLVTVSNSQGISAGVLFTNTDTIPTVLQGTARSKPLLWSSVPPEPMAGQTVTVNGRGFGLGDEPVFLRITVPSGGPVLEVGPRESLFWMDRSVTFRWPAGAPADSTVSVVTPRGESVPFTLGGTTPVTFESPQGVTVEFQARVTQPASEDLVVWGPVPSRESGTVWSLVSATPQATGGGQDLLFRWGPGPQSDRQISYQLKLTTWKKRWVGLPAGAMPASVDAPGGDPGPLALWKAASGTLKTLTAKWGLDTPDPWLRLQRLQTGLATIPSQVADAETSELTRTPSELLSSGKLTSFEISSLAVALAAQAGLPARLVGGLWLSGDRVVPRTWAEVWIPGGGWVSWDVIDGTPGSLDNRHFAFDVGKSLPERLLPRSRLIGFGAPGTGTKTSGEARGPGPEPVVQWQVSRLEK